MSELIKFLDEFIKQNTFISMILGGILCNFIYEIFKNLSLYLIKISVKKVSINNEKNIEQLISIYTEELEEVKNLYQNTQGAQLNLIESLYRNILYSFLIIIIFFTINKFGNNLFFYAFLGSSISLIFRIFSNLIYNYKLILKSKDFENYNIKINSKIENLISLLSKQQTNDTKNNRI
jgi:hypothetical protein